jgi:hypothetical protein
MMNLKKIMMMRKVVKMKTLRKTTITMMKRLMMKMIKSKFKYISAAILIIWID